MQSFDLDDKGLVALQGVNLDDTAADSNGSGKSSFLDLVSWILTGETARGSSTQDVIRRGATEAKGLLNLKEGNFVYNIIRSRTKSKETLTIYKTDFSNPLLSVGTDITKGTIKLTQDEIWKILGCSSEVFKAAIYIGQENLPDLPRMTDKQLKLIIEKAAGVECWIARILLRVKNFQN